MPQHDITHIDAWEKVASYDDGNNIFTLAQEAGELIIASRTSHLAGPAVMSYGGIATRERCFAPGLKGTNIFEIDFVDYTNDGDYVNTYMTAIGHPSDHEDPMFGLYLMGWGITIGHRKGFVGGIDHEDRQHAVQFHFDHYSKWGFGSCMNRQISSDDARRYPRFTQAELIDRLDDIYAGTVTPYRSMDDATILSARHYRPDEERAGPLSSLCEHSWGHRYGLMLSDNGNTFSWLLDGHVIDSHDITGYFDIGSDDFADGVFISIGGGAGFRSNRWRFANPRVSSLR